MKHVKKILAAALVLAPALASADPDPDAPPASATGASPAAAAPDGTFVEGVHVHPRRHLFYVRLGGILVKPEPKSSPVVLSDIDGPASLSLQNGPVVGSGATIDSAWTVGGTVGVRLPFLDQHLSLEVVVGAPFTVKFKNTGTLANQSLAPTALGLPTGVAPLGAEMGQATAAPPVLTLVYTILDHGYVQPYVGAGVGVLFTYDAEVTNPMLTAVTKPSMSVDPGVGLVGQVGVDIQLYHDAKDRNFRSWYLRLDAKYMAFVKANATVHDIVVQTPDIPLFGNVEVGTAKLSATVNPFVLSAGIGTDFL